MLSVCLFVLFIYNYLWHPPPFFPRKRYILDLRTFVMDFKYCSRREVDQEDTSATVTAVSVGLNH
jgi:hypothetical protein